VKERKGTCPTCTSTAIARRIMNREKRYLLKRENWEKQERERIKRDRQSTPQVV